MRGDGRRGWRSVAGVLARRLPGRFARSAPRDGGSVTAELAVVLPAVAALVAALAWGLQLAAAHVRLQDAAAQSARALARGDPIPERVVAAAAPEAVAAAYWEEDVVCVQVTATAGGPLGVGVALGAVSCALGGGR